MNEDHSQRSNDLVIVALSQKFNDFLERYDRDCGAFNEWRRVTDVELKMQGVILRDISPAYMRGKWIAGLVIVGSLGVAIKGFWAHIMWK